MTSDAAWSILIRKPDVHNSGTTMRSPPDWRGFFMRGGRSGICAAGEITGSVEWLVNSDTGAGTARGNWLGKENSCRGWHGLHGSRLATDFRAMVGCTANLQVFCR